MTLRLGKGRGVVRNDRLGVKGRKEVTAQKIRGGLFLLRERVPAKKRNAQTKEDK